MTNQEAFNRVWTYFVVEDHPKAVVQPNRGQSQAKCTYYGPNGERCAIGCLVSEDVAQRLEAKHSCVAASGIQLKEPELLTGLPEDPKFLDALQMAHDYSGTMMGKGFKDAFEELADTWNLEVPSD